MAPSTPSPIPIARQQMHEDKDIPDGWSDPVNSAELGRSPSPSPGAQRDNHVRRSPAQTLDLPEELDKTYDEARDGKGDIVDGSNEVTVETEDSVGCDATDGRTSQHGRATNTLDSNHNDSWHGSDEDDAEDVMNLPGSRAPPHRPQDLDSIILGDGEPTPEDVLRLKQRRKELEEEVEEDRIRHELDEDADDEASLGTGPSLEDLQEKASAVLLAPGIVAVDPEQLDKLMGSVEVEDADLMISEEISTEQDKSSSQVGSPASEKIPVLSKETSSGEACPETPTKIPLPSSTGKRVSFADFPPSVIQTPGGKHIEFAQDRSTFETPFTKTLNYFKAYKGKENSPTRPRRNASLPEEIAELAKEANEEEEHDRDLDRFRDEDLAPLDPVMQTSTAGDIMMTSTPSPKATKWCEKEDAKTSSLSKPTFLDGMSPATMVIHALEMSGHFADTLPLEVKPSDSCDEIVEYIRQQGKELGMSDEDIEKAVENFLAVPETSAVDKGDAKPADEIGEQEIEPPVFIKVIGMMPTCMFWAVAEPVAKYSSKAFDKVVEKLTGLKL